MSAHVTIPSENYPEPFRQCKKTRAISPGFLRVCVGSPVTLFWVAYSSIFRPFYVPFWWLIISNTYNKRSPSLLIHSNAHAWEESRCDVCRVPTSTEVTTLLELLLEHFYSFLSGYVETSQKLDEKQLDLSWFLCISMKENRWLVWHHLH